MTEAKKRVMIVDDDPDFILAARVALTGAGYEVAECTLAREALAKLKAFRPDLVLLDVMMETGTAGFEVSYQIRSDPELVRLPILMVTAIHGTTPLRFSPETDGEFLPVQRLLNKPVPAAVLIQQVGELLAERAQSNEQ